MTSSSGATSQCCRFFVQDRLSREIAKPTKRHDSGPRRTSKPGFLTQDEDWLRKSLPQSVNKMGPDGPCASESSNPFPTNSQMPPVSATVRIRHYHSRCCIRRLGCWRLNLETPSVPGNGGRAQIYAAAKCAPHHWCPNEPTLQTLGAKSGAQPWSFSCTLTVSFREPFEMPQPKGSSYPVDV